MKRRKNIISTILKSKDMTLNEYKEFSINKGSKKYNDGYKKINKKFDLQGDFLENMDD